MVSLTPLEDVARTLPGDETDEQARYIEAVVSGDKIRLPGGMFVSSQWQSGRHGKIPV